MNAPFSPEEVARALGGRVVGRDKVRAPSPGMPPTDESLEIIARLWREDSVDFEGRHNHLTGASISPKPVQPDLPIRGGEQAHLEIDDGRYAAAEAAAQQAVDVAARRLGPRHPETIAATLIHPSSAQR